eukprot:gene19992-30762_t
MTAEAPASNATVAKMTNKDSRSDVLAVMISAFLDDPCMHETWQDNRKYESCLRGFFESMLDHHMVDAYVLKTAEGEIAGVAIYENEKPGFLREEVSVFFYELKYAGWKSVFTTLWKFITVAGPIMSTFQKKYCPEGTVYLKLLAVSSKHHGKGFGTLLLATTLELEADRKGRKTYLESSNERNLTLYKRQGFVLQEKVPYGKAMLFPMIRELVPVPDASSADRAETDAGPLHRR